MHDETNGNSYPYYTNTGANNEYRTEQEMAAEALLVAMKKEASAIDLYSRLADAAPDFDHQENLLYALEVKQAHLDHFTNLYTYLTGTEPIYRVDQLSVDSYQEGLQKAYEMEIEAVNDYHRASLLPQNPDVYNSFLWALEGEQENAERLSSLHDDISHRIQDYGPEPFIIDIEEVTKENTNYRTALWTGEHLQITLMSIEVGGDIGLETHPNLDQFIRIEEGQGLVQMGDAPDNLYIQQEVFDDYVIVIPAGKWHNLTNTGDTPIKLYSIYAPPEHPFGTVHETKEIAMAAEEDHHY
ncbi:cupin domain-containing protein [Alkalihalophilus sp. As8PL]|uniref:Cupin domain-containing protein n=1 Tax=Alkalihalophilus sp. As8PL TaxID=3237103 RepID=A0AB39BWC9_9BACI